MTKLYTKIQSAIAARKSDDQGAAMVEYGILVAGIAVVVMGTVFLLGGDIEGLLPGRPRRAHPDAHGWWWDDASSDDRSRRQLSISFQYQPEEAQDDKATA